MSRERRVKIVSLAVEDVLDVLSLKTPQYILRLALPTLPVGYRVESAIMNWAARCFDVLVEHESFPAVPCGQTPPPLEGWSPSMVERRLLARVEGAADSPVYRE